MIARREPPFVAHAACFEGGDEQIVAFEKEIFLTAGDPEQLQFRVGARSVIERRFDLVFIHRTAEGADPGEAVEVCHAGAQRLPPAHAQTGDGALLTLG